jgi:protein gp37
MSTQDGRWWSQAWNPIHVKGGGWHCTKISPGCAHCWAEVMNKRYGNGYDDKSSFEGAYFDQRFFPGFVLDQRILEQPLHWKKPRIVAVQWLGDLFHEQIPSEFHDEILEIINRADWHKYLILTKRPQRLQDFILETSQSVGGDISRDHVWLGISICTQQEADEKIPILLQTPAAHRFVNLEPMLEPINLTRIDLDKFRAPMAESHFCINSLKSYPKGKDQRPRLDWVALGCESGPGRRPMKLEWARNIVEQCRVAGVPLWIKQIDPNIIALWHPKTKVSKNMNEWAEIFRVRQWPW